MKWGVFKRGRDGESLAATCADRAAATALAFEYTHATGIVHIARPLPDAPAGYFPAPGQAATSRDAYADVVDSMPERERSVYAFVANRPLGANEYEMEIGLRILHQSISSVTLALRRKGLLIPLRDDTGRHVERPARTKGHRGVVYVAVHPAHAVPDPTAGMNQWKRTVMLAEHFFTRGDVQAARQVIADAAALL